MNPLHDQWRCRPLSKISHRILDATYTKCTYTKSRLLLDFRIRAQCISPICRLYEPEVMPVCVGVLLGSAGQGASK